MIALGILAVVLMYGATRLASDYLRRSERSFASAARAWSEVNRSLNELLESDVPAVVAQLAILTARFAGCGYLALGVLKSHFLPRAFLRPKNRLEKAFAAVNDLKPEQKKLFDHLIISAVVYDSFRNPLLGYLFRHLVRSAVQSQPTYSATLETQLATAAVLSRKKALPLAA